jgi:hypothetical protein
VKDMNRRTFVTLIPFLPALLERNNNDIHVENIKREVAKLQAMIELTKLQQEKDLFWEKFKFDRALYERH